MSWLAVKRTGSGEVGYRLSVEGWPYEWVTSGRMSGVTADGRERLNGLKGDGIQITERVDLATAKPDVQGIGIRIADIGGRVTESFRSPSWRTYLIADAAVGATTLTTGSLGSTPIVAGDHVFLNSEAIEVGAVAASSFTGCTRGEWGTLDQAHYTTSGAGLRYPEITDYPQTLEGRRAKIYAYGSGDDPQGDGHLIWAGVAGSDARYDGEHWRFRVDPITAILNRDLGSDLDAPATIRGSYYPALWPLEVQLKELSTNDFSSAPAATATINFQFAGHDETQAEFCARINAEIETRRLAASWVTPRMWAAPDGDSWAFFFESGGRYVEAFFLSAVDGIYRKGTSGRESIFTVPAGTVAPDTLTTGTVYKVVHQGSGLGTIPRAVLGPNPEVTAGRFSPSNDPATYPSGRVYLGGSADIDSSIDTMFVEWDSTGFANEADRRVPVASGEAVFGGLTVNTADRHVTVNGRISLTQIRNNGEPIPASSGGFAFTGSGEKPSIRFTRTLAEGTLQDLLEGLIADAPTYMNSGAGVDLRAEDFDFTNGVIPQQAARSRVLSRRSWSYGKGVKLSDVIEHECRLLGVYPALTADGKISFKPLRLPTDVEMRRATITGRTAVVSNGWLAYERSPLGIYNTIELATGYSPREDSHKGRLWRLRDVSAYGISKRSRVLSIEPKSVGPFIEPVDSDAVQLIAGPIFGVFGSPYRIVTVGVPLSMFDITVGDVVAVTWSKVPDGEGGKGVENMAGLVIGRQFTPREARGELTLLVSERRVTGYAPSGRIETITGASGGTAFTLTLSTGYLPSGTTPDEWWEAGDAIRLVRWDSAVATGTTLGTVTAFTPTGLVITTDTAWAHAAHPTWWIGPQVSTSITRENQKRFCFVADSDLTLDFGGGDVDNPPFTFGV